MSDDDVNETPQAGADQAATLEAILEELRTTRREQRHEDFSIARLAASVAQAFALCAVGWALFVWMDGADGQRATIALLTGIAFQLMALTWFVASRR